MLHVCLLALHLLQSSADEYYCDGEVAGDAGALDGYSYTCDDVPQCIDGSDELGCTDCPSGTLLLLGIPPDSPYFQYETLFVKQTYMLQNRPVYKTPDSSPRVGYITYSHTNEWWSLSEDVDSGTVLLSETTLYAEPFLVGILWRTEENGTALPDIKLHCVTSDHNNKCSGNLLLVTRDTVLVLEATTKISNNRAVYEAGNFSLQYVASSTDWDTPHWQVVSVSGEESVVFLGSSAINPEYVNTPGLYKLESGGWVKSSNVYLTCEVLRNDTTNPLDCIFQVDICEWSSRGDLAVSLGSAEQFSIGQRLPPSLYVTADQYTAAGKYKLTSSEFTLEQESCFLLTLANTMYIESEHTSNFTVTVQDLYSTRIVWSLTQCTDCPDNYTCSCDQISYSTHKISLSPAQDMQVIITIEVGDNAQRSGIISLSETALIQSPCDDVELDWLDSCYDFDFPCDYHFCLPSGLRGYECQCVEDSYGPTCQSNLNCSVDDVIEPDNVEYNSTRVFNTYVYMECIEGYEIVGDLPRCTSNGTWTAAPSCVELACPDILIPHGNFTRNDNYTRDGNSTTVGARANFACDPGFLLAGEVSLECSRGTWSSSAPSCLLDCSFPSEEVDDDAGEQSITVDLLICDYSASAQGTNFTNCQDSNATLDDTGYLQISADLHLRLDSKGKLCVRYADRQLETMSCRENCLNSILMKLVRTLDQNTDQFVEVTTNFDYIVVSSGLSVACSGVLALIFIRLLFLT